MCFKPKANTKVLLNELDRDKRCLEQDNSLLRGKLQEQTEAVARLVKDRDSLRQQRAELNGRLQQHSAHASQLLTQVTCLRSDFALRLQELLGQHIPATLSGQALEKAPVGAPGAANVVVVQPECIEDEADTNAMQPQALLDTGDCAPSPVRPLGCTGEEGTDSSGRALSVEEQLDKEVATLACVHKEAATRIEQLQQLLHDVGADRAALQADVAGVRRRMELAEASATDQQQVLQLRCAALEQENEQLTGMNEEMQQRLEAALGELSTLKKQWNTDAGQLTRQAAELEASNGRVREAETEIRALGTHLAEAVGQAQEASAKATELQEQAAARATELEATGAALVAREAELEAARGEVRRLQDLASHQQQLYESTAAELRDARTSERSTKDALEATRIQLDSTRRDLAAAAQQLASQGQALADAQAQLQESRAALASTGERLARALEDLAAAEAQAAEANAQYLNTKQSVISTAKQLASMAKDHSTVLARLHTLEAEATALREQLASSRAAETKARARADANGAAAREARAAADVSEADARRLRSAYDGACADLRRKIMVLTAIARMANKGQAAASGGRSRESQDAEQADSYSAVTSEQKLRLKICEAPLPLLGALTSGIMDSSRLRHLALDMDTSREVTWEKAGLRICCLAAAVGLNNSLQTLQLGGWTWGELGNGTALPFLALGGGGGMLRSVQLATNLFDVEAAAMLRDLLAAGLVELAAGGGEEDESGSSGGKHQGETEGRQGTLRLYSGNARLDGWYRDMLQMAACSGTQLRSSLMGRSLPAGGATSSSVQRATGSVHAGDSAYVCSSSGSRADDVSSVASGYSRQLSRHSGGGATVGMAAVAQAVECDLSAEALESHHMVLVMTVLLTCPGLRRLRLDGNKLGDGGAAVLALGLSGNTGLRELNLSRNNIRSAGARSLARCLEGANSTLLRLDVSGQRMEGLGVAGAEALAQALRVNRALEDLNLSSCGLAGSAAAAFSGAIRAAGASRPLTPSSTSSDGSSRPSTASSTNTGSGCLRRLTLSGNGVDAATAKALQAAAAEQPGLVLTL